MASALITQMMCDATSNNSRRQRLGVEQFLRAPKITRFFSRLQMFRPNDSSLDAFKQAGCDSHLLTRCVLCPSMQSQLERLILIISPWRGTRIMQVVRGPTQSLEDKVELLNDYISRLIQHHLESLENNDFRSKNGQFAAKYIKQARGTLCRDMRRLIMTVMPSFYNFMQVGDPTPCPTSIHA